MSKCSSIMFAAALMLSMSLERAVAGDRPFPNFEHRVIDPEIGKVCYAVTVADVDGDKRLDIVAVSENRVLWYQAPDWKKRVMIENQTELDNVCIAPFDIDADGQVDFALGAGWTKVGTIQWLSRGKSLDEKWNVHLIDQEPWLHRMRFADVLDKGKPQLVISPLNKTTGDGVRLTAFTIPNNPRKDRWERTLLDGSMNKMHNHWHLDFDGNGTIDTLTASEEGIHLVTRRGGSWQKQQISTSSAGEVKTGSLRDGGRFIVSVQPMHGNSLAVYLRKTAISQEWTEHVLVDDLVRGHAIWPADVDGDGDDEIVVGHSNTKEGESIPRGVFVFDADTNDRAKWTKYVIDDGGVAVEDAMAADLTGDGRIDIVVGGRYTHNLKLYINRGK